MSGLFMDNVWKRFGGNEVLKGLKFSVEPSSIVGLIATNGAGKTTVLNVLFGIYRRDRGHMWFRGGHVPERPHKVVRGGIARTFQNAQLPADMTVAEVIQAVLINRSGSSFLRRDYRKRLQEELNELLATFALTDVAHSHAGKLPFGIQRRADLARAIATGATLVFLDEPAAGLTDDEESELAITIRTLRNERGIGFVIIDHRINFLTQVIDRLLVMNDGQIALDSADTDLHTVLLSDILREHYFSDKMSPDHYQEKSRVVVSSGGKYVALAVEDLVIERAGVPAVRCATHAFGQSAMTAIIGPNGAGKSSLLQCLAGVLPPKQGKLFVDGKEVTTNQLSRRKDIVLVSESVDVFPCLTVKENLKLVSTSNGQWGRTLDMLRVHYPWLFKKLPQSASLLSGGERKVLALVRAMSAAPHVILADEPSAGLAPGWAKQVYEMLRAGASPGGTTTVVAESNAITCEPYVDDSCSMRKGQIVNGRAIDHA